MLHQQCKADKKYEPQGFYTDFRDMLVGKKSAEAKPPAVAL